MTEDIEWGPEIKVDGKRPEWLEGDVECMVGWVDGSCTGPYLSGCIYGWGRSISAIRLPADHPYYTRKEPVTEDGGEYVRVKKMTAKEWDALVAGRAVSWARELGIITETPVERFKRENPGLTADELLVKALEGGTSSRLSGAEVQHG